MNPNPSPRPTSPERQTPTTEIGATYKDLEYSIISGDYNLRELNGALTRGDIDLVQHSELSFLLLEKLDKIVGTDPLTGLFNRAFLGPKLNGLKEELNHLEEKRRLPIRSVMVIFLDIKEFKKLNDTHGHRVGDQALVAVADRLKKSTKRGDMVFRVGGDEFVILLPITDVHSNLPQLIFERIKSKINTDLSVRSTNLDDSEGVSFSLSMGYEILNRGDVTTSEELLDRADKKMYGDKRKPVTSTDKR